MKEQAVRNRFLYYILPAILVVALILACVWGAEKSTQAQSYQRSLEQGYRQGFIELVNHMNDLEVTLRKLMVVNSPAQYILMLDDIWRLSGSTVSTLSKIPASHVDTMGLNQFIIRVGDYARVLTKKVVNGALIGDEDMEQLESLHEACANIAKELQNRLDSEDYPVAVITADGYYVDSSQSAQDNANDGTGQEDESRTKYPTLIYDGPFSESAEKAEPRALENEQMVSREQALSTALNFIGGGTLGDAQDSLGNIPAYDFTGKTADERDVDISISQQGGRVIWMMSTPNGAAEGVPPEEETARYRDVALAFLSQNGYENMQPAYAQYYAGVAVINFVPTQDDVLLYSDLVKVWVERDGCRVTGIDARNYLYSHVQRELGEASLTQEQAREYVSVNLEIQEENLALIPITPTVERLCYEFKGKYGETSYIVYINAMTGAEEQIFEIIDSNDGQLVV